MNATFAVRSVAFIALAVTADDLTNSHLFAFLKFATNRLEAQEKAFRRANGDDTSVYYLSSEVNYASNGGLDMGIDQEVNSAMASGVGRVLGHKVPFNAFCKVWNDSCEDFWWFRWLNCRKDQGNDCEEFEHALQSNSPAELNVLNQKSLG